MIVYATKFTFFINLQFVLFWRLFFQYWFFLLYIFYSLILNFILNFTRTYLYFLLCWLFNLSFKLTISLKKCLIFWIFFIKNFSITVFFSSYKLFSFFLKFFIMITIFVVWLFDRYLLDWIYFLLRYFLIF